MSRALLLALLALHSAAASAGDLVLNELFYDPPGSDGGYEFVELFNPTDNALSAAGLELVFVNGADPESPRSLWRCSEELLVGAGAFFVLGDEEVEPVQVRWSLALQNGPDALWLLRDGRRIDAVAWGELENLAEGAPAPDVSSTSLGRVPDGADSDDNASDWFELQRPSPGAPNAQEASWELVGLNAQPPWRGRAGDVEFELHAIASGFGAQQQGSLQWLLDGTIQDIVSLSASRDDSIRLRHTLWLAEGPHRVVVRATASAAQVDSQLLAYRVGLSQVALNEVMARPEGDEPEWVELVGLTGAPSELDGWAIADASRVPRMLSGAPPCGEGRFVLLTADANALIATRAPPVAVPVVELSGSWPALNNSPDAQSGVSDEVWLMDPSGAVVDGLVYGESLASESGRSMERGLLVAGSGELWFASPGLPTPGLANVSASAPPPRPGLSLAPNPFSPDGDGQDDVLHVLLELEEDAVCLEAEVLDLLGDRVRQLGSDQSGGRLRQWIWDGRDQAARPAPLGAYVVVVREGAERGKGPTRSWRALVVLGRRG